MLVEGRFFYVFLQIWQRDWKKTDFFSSETTDLVVFVCSWHSAKHLNTQTCILIYDASVQSMCVSLRVRIEFSSNNQIRARSRPSSSSCSERLSKENQSPLPVGFSAFFLACKTLLLPIRFNWKVMKFLFKEMIQVYEDRWGDRAAYLGVVLREGRVCASQTRSV